MNFFVFAQEGGAGGTGMSSLIFLALMIGVFYFLIIRPQRKRAKDQQQLSESLMPGQEIRTIGGIHGTVLSVDDDSVLLRVEEGKIRVAKRAVGARVGGDPNPIS